MSLRVFVDLDLPPATVHLLREGMAGHELLLPSARAPSVLVSSPPDPLLETAHIAFGQPDPATIARAHQLEWIHVSSSSITRYDNAEFRTDASRRHLVMSNSAQVYAEPCALHTLSFILAEARNLPGSLGQLTRGGSERWSDLRERCVPLSGQTLLILGYGAIGARLAELLLPLGMRVIAYRRRVHGNEAVPVVLHDGLTQALQGADHVVNILPESAATTAFFDERRFAQLRPGAVFYNIGRGTTVANDALLASLRAGRLKAAWLDVTDPEPLPPGHPLLEEPRCHVTPHLAGGHANETESLVRHFLENLRRFMAREPLIGRVM